MHMHEILEKYMEYLLKIVPDINMLKLNSKFDKD